MEAGKITTGFLFIQPLYALAFNLLIVFYRLFGQNLGLAIITFTLAIKLATLPFSIRQANSAKKNKEFQEKYKAIQAKHKNAKDKEKMTQELAQLQSEYLPAQLGGCLPTILQLLFFFQVYYVVINSINVGVHAFNDVNYDFIPEFPADATLDLTFLGMNLGQSASQIGFNNFGAVLPYLLLILLVGLTQFVSSRVLSGLNMMPGQKQTEAEAGKGGKKDNKKDKKSKAANKSGKEGKAEVQEDLSFSDALQQSTQSTLYILPLMTMALGLTFPAGLSLYWTISNGFVIIQQLVVNREAAKAWLKTRFGK